MVPRRTRRELVATLGVAASLGLTGCSALTGGDGTAASPTEQTEPPTTESSSTETSGGSQSVASLSVAVTDSDYAVLGSENAGETATLYGGWKCPYTREFVLQMLPSIIEEYIAPGELALEFRAVQFQADESWGDDEPRANRAGLAVWHEVPEGFPAYVETLYSN